jgi:hypothetical protein
MREKNRDDVVLKKIALQKFIETLVEVYNSGADYVDLVGNHGEIQDSIAIVVHQEYLSKDEDEFEIIMDDDEEEEEKDVKKLTNDKPLSDEDINDLI